MMGVRGLFFWTDCGYRSGWRLQKHFRDGSFRLLSPNHRVVLRGSESECRSELNRTAQRLQLDLPTGRVAVLLHGLARNAWSMGAMAKFLARKGSFDEVVLYQYASTTAPVSEHALRWIQFSEYLRAAREVHFVAHSLGNIVLRRAYRMAEQGEWQLPRVASHVMLGPPNQGAEIARRMEHWVPVAWFTGAPFMQLGRDWVEFQSQLTTPPCPFGIIAGRLPLLDRFHPALSGPNDVIVGVEETRLAGAADFLEVRVPHNWLMNSRRVQQATILFQEKFRFELTNGEPSSGEPSPREQPNAVATGRRVG